MNSSKRTKLLLICEYFPPHVGGAEKLLDLHARTMAKTGKYDVRVITSQQQSAPKLEKVAPFCEVFRYPWREAFGHPVANLSDLHVHTQWADIVHTVTYSCAIQALMSARKYRKPTVLSFYEVLGWQWLSIGSNPFVGACFMLFELLLTKLPFTYFHAISNHTYSKLIKHVSSTKCTMIYPFVDKPVPNSLPVPCSDYFLFFGRAGRTKGLAVLIKAIKILADESIQPLFVLIIAEHPKEERLKVVDDISKYQLSNVIVLDQQPKSQLVAYIQHAKAVIVPSLTEGFGYAAYEASALGNPVIFSSDTSLEEVVSLGKQFEMGNSQSLGDVIAKSKSTKWDSKQPNISNENSILQWMNLYDAIRT